MAEYRDDALAALRSANPVQEPGSGSPVAPIGGADVESAQVRAILAAPPVDGRTGQGGPARVRHRGTTIAVAVVAVVLAAAWAMVRERHVDDPMTVVCYSQAQTPASAGRDAQLPLELLTEERTSDPFAQCASAWTDARWERIARQPAPPLVGCVLTDGTLAVLPGSSGAVCDRLDMARWNGRYRGDADRVRGVTVALMAWHVEHPCPSDDDADRVVRANLAGRGLAGWSVVVGDDAQPATPCATFEFRYDRRTIVVAHAPRLDA